MNVRQKWAILYYSNKLYYIIYIENFIFSYSAMNGGCSLFSRYISVSLAIQNVNEVMNKQMNSIDDSLLSSFFHKYILYMSLKFEVYSKFSNRYLEKICFCWKKVFEYELTTIFMSNITDTLLDLRHHIIWYMYSDCNIFLWVWLDSMNRCKK